MKPDVRAAGSDHPRQRLRDGSRPSQARVHLGRLAASSRLPRRFLRRALTAEREAAVRVRVTHRPFLLSRRAGAPQVRPVVATLQSLVLRLGIVRDDVRARVARVRDGRRRHLGAVQVHVPHPSQVPVLPRGAASRPRRRRRRAALTAVPVAFGSLPRILRGGDGGVGGGVLVERVVVVVERVVVVVGAVHAVAHVVVDGVGVEAELAAPLALGIALVVVVVVVVRWRLAAGREGLAGASAARARSIHADLDPADAHDGVALDVRVGFVVVPVLVLVVVVVVVERAAARDVLLGSRLGVVVAALSTDPPAARSRVGVRLMHLAVFPLRAPAVSGEEPSGRRALERDVVTTVIRAVDPTAAGGRRTCAASPSETPTAAVRASAASSASTAASAASAAATLDLRAPAHRTRFLVVELARFRYRRLQADSVRLFCWRLRTLCRFASREDDRMQLISPVVVPLSPQRAAHPLLPLAPLRPLPVLVVRTPPLRSHLRHRRRRRLLREL